MIERVQHNDRVLSPNAEPPSDQEVLAAAALWWSDYSQPEPLVLLASRGHHPQVSARKIRDLVHRGLLEVGAHPRYVWPKEAP